MAIKERFDVVQAQCTCGEPISVEIGRKDVCRRDGKRPFYPDGITHNSPSNTTVLRCRNCGGWLGDTCEEAAFE